MGGPGGNPYITTHDGRTIRFPDPDVKMNDTVLVDLDTGKIANKCKFEVGAMCMIKGGNNTGRVGVITTRDKHPGSHEIIHVKDASGNSFSTRIGNVMVIGARQRVDLASEGQGYQAQQYRGPRS